MSWKPPKEFGGTSPEGLAQLRALGQIDLPFAKSITPGVQAYKADGFDRVNRTQAAAPASTSLYLAEGRRAFNTGSHVALTTAPGTPCVDLTASVVAGGAGAITYAGRNTVLAGGFESDGVYRAYRTTDFNTKVLELELNPPLSAYTSSAVATSANVAVAATGPYNLTTADVYNASAGEVTPFAARRTDTGDWTSRPMSAYGSYDHSNQLGTWQITPDRVIGCWGVFARQTFYAFATGTRPNSPIGVATPYPLLEVSVDAGQTFAGYPMDALFTGCTTGWRPWDTFGSTPAIGTSVGGYEPCSTFLAVVLRNTMLFGFRVIADAGLEYRMFRVANVTATADYPSAAVRVTTPPGFGTTWNFLAGAFSERTSNSIVLITSRASLTVPARLLITTDAGASWVDRPLPWPGLYTGEVKPLSAQTICAAVYNPIKFGVELYVSKDLGVTWKVAGMVATNTYPPNLTEGFQDFSRFQQINLTTDGLEPTPDPMAPYRYNFRYHP